MDMATSNGHLGFATTRQFEGIRVVPQPPHMEATEALGDVDHARLLASALTVLVLPFVHLQDHDVRAQVKQEIRPLPATGWIWSWLVASGHQSIDCQ